MITRGGSSCVAPKGLFMDPSAGAPLKRVMNYFIHLTADASCWHMSRAKRLM